MTIFSRFLRPLPALSTVPLLAALSAGALASGGGESPASAQDPQTDLCGVFAFVGTRYDDPGQEVLNVLVQLRPFAQAGSGLTFPRFPEDARYSVHVTHPLTGAQELRYDFRFSDVDSWSRLQDPDTILSYGEGSELGAILSVGDSHQNYLQTFTVARRQGGVTTVLGQGLSVAPPNVGARTTPLYNDPMTGAAVSGAVTPAELDGYTAQTVHQLPGGEVVFAGTRDDAFYGDLPGIYDLLHPRVLAGDGQQGNGPDGFADSAALSLCIQIPLDGLPSHAYTDLFGNSSSGVGVYATASRSLRRRTGALSDARPDEQVARMGNPLLGQLLLPLRHKGAWQRSTPADDTGLSGVLAAPALARLFNELAAAGFVESNRNDLVQLYLPDVLRVDTTTGPVALPGQVGFNRLSVFGGDTIGGRPGGWPNGRRPGDDVVDILFTVLASGPSFAQVVVRGDNVAANDQLYHQVFPYLATPPSGTNP